MESQLKEPADRRHISLFMNGYQMPIMSRPHSGQSRPHSGQSREQHVITANGTNSSKGFKDLKYGSDKSCTRTEGSSSHGVYEESNRRGSSASSDVHHYNILSRNDSENDELSALFACSTALASRIRSKTTCDKASNSSNSKTRPHTAYTNTEKAKSSSWTEVKKDDNKLIASGTRGKSGNRKVLHRSLSISSLPDRMNFGKVSNHRRNRVPMLNCYCLNDELNTDVLPKIIDAASYARSKADQRKNLVTCVISATMDAELIAKENDSSPPAFEEPVSVHAQSEVLSKVTSVSPLLPVMGFKLGQNEAASRIQKWYKRHSARRKAADAALRRMRSSPRSGLLKTNLLNVKLTESSLDTRFYQSLPKESLQEATDCMRKARTPCHSNKSELQRKKSSIALHIVQLKGDNIGCNTSNESEKIVPRLGDLEATVPKERHLINRRRRSEGDVSKRRCSSASTVSSERLKATDQQRRSLSDGALIAEVNKSLKLRNSNHRPQTPQTCTSAKPSSKHDRVQLCTSVPYSQIQHRTVAKVKVKLPTEKNNFSNDSLDIVQNNPFDGEVAKKDDNKGLAHSLRPQELVDYPISSLVARRPSDDEAVIIRPLPNEQTSDSTASSSNDAANNYHQTRGNVSPSLSRHKLLEVDVCTGVNGQALCEELNPESDVMVDELFSDTGKLFANENIIPLQLKNIERLLLRSSSTEVSASPRTAVTSVNSEACAVDSLEGCLENPSQLIPIAPCHDNIDVMLPNSTIATCGHQEKGLTVEQVEKLNRQSILEHSENIGILTESKLRDIMAFLDEVEHTDDLSDVRARTALPKPMMSSRLRKVVGAASDVGYTQRKYMKNEVVNIERFKKISIKSHLNRKAISSDSLDSSEEIKNTIVPICSRNQVIERQLAFIDQLLEEKALMTNKYEQLLKGAKDSEKKYEQKLKHMKEQHAFDLKRYRDWQAAKEKVRREKWIAEQTKRIQEKTAHAMEPEIKKLMIRHHADVDELKELHAQEMLETDAEMQKRLDSEIQKVQTAVAENVDRAVAKEREAAEKRLQACLEQERACFEDKHQHFIEEITHLRNLLEIQEQQCYLKLEQARNNFEASQKKEVESLQGEYIRRHEDELLKHQSEIKRLKEKLHHEYSLKEESLQKQHEEALVAQEKVLREQYKKDRDQQIELVLRRLEDETTASRQESDRATEHRIRSLREKHDTEVEELERVQQSTAARLQEMKIRLASIEEENLMLRDTCKQKRLEINELTKIITQLNKNKTVACEAIQQQYEQQMSKTSKSVEELQRKLVEMEEHYRLQREKIQAEHKDTLAAKDKELDDVGRRVRFAISKKDDAIGKLKADYNAALTRADQYEKLLIKFKK